MASSTPNVGLAFLLLTSLKPFSAVTPLRVHDSLTPVSVLAAVSFMPAVLAGVTAFAAAAAAASASAYPRAARAYGAEGHHAVL